MERFVILGFICLCLIQTVSSLQCYTCYSIDNPWACYSQQSLETCGSDYNKCVSFTDLQQNGIRLYHKICGHHTIPCQSMCTNYVKNGNKCSEGDKAVCCSSDKCNDNESAAFFQDYESSSILLTMTSSLVITLLLCAFFVNIQ